MILDAYNQLKYLHSLCVPVDKMLSVPRPKKVVPLMKSVLGRMYPGKAVPEEDNYGYTIAELKEKVDSGDLVGRPLWLEHSPPAIGEFEKAWMDPGGYLCVWANLYPPDRISKPGLYERVQEGVHSGKYRDFSIHWSGTRNRAGIVEQDSKVFIEGSLTEAGAHQGTHVFSVAASEKDRSSRVTRSLYGNLVMDMQEVQKMLTDNGIQIDAQKLQNISPVQIAAFIAAEVAKAKDSSAKEVEAKLAPQTNLTETERQRLQLFEKQEEQRIKLVKEKTERYAEKEKKNVAGVFEAIKDMVPEEEHKSLQEDLGVIATDPAAKSYWNVYKLMTQRIGDKQKTVDEATKAVTKLSKDNTHMMKELREKQQHAPPEPAPRQVVEEVASAKRNANIGVPKTLDAKRQKVDVPTVAGTKVEEEASALSKMESQMYPQAFAVPHGYDMEDEAASTFISFIHEKQRNVMLGAGQPLLVQNHFRGKDKKYATRYSAT